MVRDKRTKKYRLAIGILILLLMVVFFAFKISNKDNEKSPVQQNALPAGTDSNIEEWLASLDFENAQGYKHENLQSDLSKPSQKIEKQETVETAVIIDIPEKSPEQTKNTVNKQQASELASLDFENAQGYKHENLQSDLSKPSQKIEKQETVETAVIIDIPEKSPEQTKNTVNKQQASELASLDFESAQGYKHENLQPDLSKPSQKIEKQETVETAVIIDIPEKSPEQTKNTVNKQQASEIASILTDMLSGNGDPALKAKKLLASKLGDTTEKWLNQFATARIQLDIDEDFSLKNSQLDLLVPFLQKKDSLFFTQASWHQTDNRNQINLGLGYRWFNNDWMLGANAFCDYDASFNHSRMGLGAEYSRDFLKLNANAYLRLTDWKSSQILSGFQERPANGWDVRAKFWLPQLPQLTGKLIFEQYYGNEVALFSSSNRSHNPAAVTAAIEYRPFPLLAFNIAHKQGLSNGEDTIFSVMINYQLGVPWASQIDPSKLSKIKSLQHNRYELVERNNNIVLEYKKKVVKGATPAKDKSSISVNTDSYAIDDKITVVINLYDTDGSAISGLLSLLETGVSVTNAVSNETWTENNGVYTKSYTATGVGSNLYATLTLSDYWAESIKSDPYSIVMPTLEGIVNANDYVYTPTSGFPQTGFYGANFSLKLNTGKLSDYTWNSTETWASVNNGIVSFYPNDESNVNGNKVTITGQPSENSNRTPITYEFTLKYWYVNNGKNYITKNDAISYCQNLGYSIPTTAQANGSGGNTAGSQGTLGALWNEWGDITAYKDATSVNVIWVTEGSYYVYLTDGHRSGGGTNVGAACRVDL